MGLVQRQARRGQRLVEGGALDQPLDAGPGGPQTVRGFGQREQQVDPLGLRHALADDVESVRDQGLFEFHQGEPEDGDPGRHVAVPGGLGRHEVEGSALRLDQEGQRAPLGHRLGLQGTPALDRGLEVDQPAIEPGGGETRGQVADQRRGGAALGQRALGGVVGGVEVDVRQRTDQPVRPAGRRQAGLLAGHEFQCPVGAEMQHGVGAKILA